MGLTPQSRERIREMFIQLTTGHDPFSKRQAWKRIAEEMDVSVTTAKYWSDERLREQFLEAEARRRNKPDVAAQYKKWREAYRSRPEIKERKKKYDREYTRLRQSRLAREVLPRVFEKAGREVLQISELSSLIHGECRVAFQDSTLVKLLIDQYSGSIRGPPLEESPKQPGYYILRPEFYQAK